MKLNSICEGHWVISPDPYQGSILPKARKPKRHSIFVDLSDRDRFMRKMKLAEGYNGEIDEDELINAPTDDFDDSWKEYDIPPPPSNKDKITKKELAEIISLVRKNDQDTKKAIAKQDTEDLEDFFFSIIDGVDAELTSGFKRRISDIVSQLTTIGLHFKLLFNRSRPIQLLSPNDKKLVTGGKTAKSPSYPSSHALIGKFLADLLSEIYPDLKGDFIKLGRDLGLNRVKAGYHFKTDYDAGVKLAQHLYKVNRDSIIKSLS